MKNVHLDIHLIVHLNVHLAIHLNVLLYVDLNVHLYVHKGELKYYISMFYKIPDPYPLNNANKHCLIPPPRPPHPTPSGGN